jgi:hypothetical protein
LFKKGENIKFGTKYNLILDFRKALLHTEAARVVRAVNP